MNLFRKSRIQSAAHRDDVLELIRSLRPKPCGRSLIRIGSEGDGGYLLPDDLEGIAACFSPGVSTEVSFDLEMANRGMNVYMADASIDQLPENHDNFHFYKKFLGVVNDEKTMTLDKFRSVCKIDDDCILQMDIENSEYAVLLSTSENVLKSFRIMVIEFHRFDDLFGRFQFELIKALFDKLLFNHDVVHIHPNNCCPVVKRFGLEVPRVMEFTLLRKDRFLTRQSDKLVFPHPLDRDNVPGKPHLTLPRCWHPDAD